MWETLYVRNYSQLGTKFVFWLLWWWLQGKKDLVAVDNTEYEGDEGELEDSENEERNDEGQDNSSSDIEDSDEERKRWLIGSFSIVAVVLLCNDLNSCF